MRAKLLLTVACMLPCLVFAGQVSTYGKTNNQVHFNGSSNQVNGGRWSYLSRPNESGGFQILTEHYPSGTVGENWCVDDAKASSSYTWSVFSDGGMKTDSRDMAFAYTIDTSEYGPIAICGSLLGGSCRLRIYKSSDSSLTSIGSNLELIYDQTTSSHRFDLYTSVRAGNDVIFVMDNSQYWSKRYLDATIQARSSTHTVTDWDGVSNSISPGKWAYMQRPNEQNGFSLLASSYDSATVGENWCVDPAKASSSYTWAVYDDGSVRTDSRDMAFNYTAKEDGKYRILGSLSGTGSCRLRVYRSSDSSATAHGSLSLIYSLSKPHGSSTVAFNVTLDQYNDLIFTIDNCQYYWTDQKLSVSVTPLPEFKDFSGDNQGNVSRSIWTDGHAMWGRPAEIAWHVLEPTQGNWNDAALTTYGDKILAYRNAGYEVLPLLAYGTDWSGSSNRHVDAAHVADWENYVRKVVTFLRQPPYNLTYFQIWNEALDVNWISTGFWNGTAAEYYNNVHLPASQIIHDLGGKVVYGGWPSAASPSSYINALDTYNVWESLDVLDIHYFPPSDMKVVLDAAKSRGYGDLAIWQTEYGFMRNRGQLTHRLIKTIYWAINDEWTDVDKAKLFWFAEWAPDDPAAYGYRKSLYSGSNLYHGLELQTMGNLLEGGPLAPYENTYNNLGLEPSLSMNFSTSLTIEVDDKLVTFCNISSDWIAEGSIRLYFPEITSMSQVSSISRVDPSGYSQSLSGSIVNGQLQIDVSFNDSSQSPIQSWTNYDQTLFYVNIERN